MSDIPESQQGPQKKVKGIVDIVFLMDATGSMQPCIDALKNNVKLFIGELTGGANNQKPVKEWRAKVVAYRDFIFDKEPLVDNPFTEDPAVLESQLGALIAEGGGDEPESLLEGIYHAAEMGQTDKDEPLSPDKWRARNAGARAVIVFTDATYHEVMEEPKGGTFNDVKNSVTANKIMLQVFAPQDMDCHAALSRIDKAAYYEYEYDETREDGAAKGLEEFTSNTKNFQETLAALARTLSQSADEETEVL